MLSFRNTRIIVISCLFNSNHTFYYFYPPAFSNAAATNTYASLRRGTNTNCLLHSCGPRVSHSASWHARSHFYCVAISYSYFLLCLFSCSFQRRSLDHSNKIKGENSSSFSFVSFWAKIGETDRQSIFDVFEFF